MSRDMVSTLFPDICGELAESGVTVVAAATEQHLRAVPANQQRVQRLGLLTPRGRGLLLQHARPVPGEQGQCGRGLLLQHARPVPGEQGQCGGGLLLQHARPVPGEQGQCGGGLLLQHAHPVPGEQGQVHLKRNSIGLKTDCSFGKYPLASCTKHQNKNLALNH